MSYEPPITTILADACAATGLSRAELLGEGRVARLAHVRFAIVWAARTALGISHPRIARTLYPRGDHTASLHAWRRAEVMIARDPGFATLARHLAACASNRTLAHQQSMAA
jgi:chromosomal replication initiation ATPase DnaA